MIALLSHCSDVAGSTTSVSGEAPVGTGTGIGHGETIADHVGDQGRDRGHRHVGHEVVQDAPLGVAFEFDRYLGFGLMSAEMADRMRTASIYLMVDADAAVQFHGEDEARLPEAPAALRRRAPLRERQSDGREVA